MDSCTWAWHTGQLTISAEEDEEAAAVDDEEVLVLVLVPAAPTPAAVLCCAAGDLAFIDSLAAADSALGVLWKRSKMEAQLPLRSSHDLFLEV